MFLNLNYRAIIVFKDYRESRLKNTIHQLPYEPAIVFGGGFGCKLAGLASRVLGDHQGLFVPCFVSISHDHGHDIV